MTELATIYYYQGLSLAEEQRITPAIDRLEKAIALNPENWKAWNILGLCQYLMGEFSKAKGAWLESLEVYREDNPAIYYLKELESPELISVCQRYNRALELAGQGDYKGAIKVFGKQECEFSIISFLNFAGLCLYGLGRPGKAISLWKTVLELDRENSDAQSYINKTINKRLVMVTLEVIWDNIVGIFLPRKRRKNV